MEDLITFELVPSSGSKIAIFLTKNHFNQKSDISEISNILLFTLLDWNIEIKWANPIRTNYNQSGFDDVKSRHDIKSYNTIFGGSSRSEMENFTNWRGLICETLTSHGILQYPSSVIVLSFVHKVCFLMNICHFAIFTQKRLQEGEKRAFIYAWAEYYLQPNTVGRRCAWADHYLYTVICRSRGKRSADEKEEKFTLNDKISY